MKPLVLLAVSGLLLSATACAPGAKPPARTALDCPAAQGPLKRQSQAPDGKSCRYADGHGDEVELRLAPVASDPQAALAPIEAELRAELAPSPTATPAASAADPAVAKAASDSAANLHRAAVAHMGRHRHSDRAEVDIPGLHISADDDRASVQMGQLNIDADAGSDTAAVRATHDVRLRGEALSRERRGFRATYKLYREPLKDGFHSVGYEAAGPRTGPLAVAVVKLRDDQPHGLSRSVRRLVRRNGGV